ncbi:hypothetical protein [Rhizobium sp. C4]|uniref:hypothetical protein n=1 Tax=Rhizobium sp. C4 TaxID=1349800 RepID=UPI001E4634E1|nr:hypothetical protein [Rhizobium sp. C4]MCD2171583.1 hypothetical protein [Rhizobium sp. C4]
MVANEKSGSDLAGSDRAARGVALGPFFVLAILFLAIAAYDLSDGILFLGA